MKRTFPILKKAALSDAHPVYGRPKEETSPTDATQIRLERRTGYSYTSIRIASEANSSIKGIYIAFVTFVGEC
ncbi:hypothetical protein, partial [Mesorhizobium sp.]|uniref:hypothetical protein n=1 Tax=Mesorhizobium sp. TaxID=1871066 RepID=UPI0025E0C9E2